MTQRDDIVAQIVASAIRLPADERSQYLAARCTQDTALLNDVEALLRCHNTTNEDIVLTSLTSGSPCCLGQSILSGRYELIAQLGIGGMGVVYEAWQQSPRRKVAIKVLASKIAQEESAVERLRREAALLAHLDHPGIVKVIEFGADQGTWFIVMEYVAGPGGQAPTTLKDVLDRGPLEEARVRDLMRDITAALSFAHGKGVIHRDIKPSNILIDRDGKPRIIDFGIAACDILADAKLTLGNMSLGTQAYMSPEQRWSAGTVDHRADIYSLGLVLYEMLVGRVPNVGSPPASEAQPGLDAKWDAVISKALQENPNLRPPSMVAFWTELERALGFREEDTRKRLAQKAPSSVNQDDTRSSASAHNPLIKHWTARSAWLRLVVSSAVFLASVGFAGNLLRLEYYWWSALLYLVSVVFATEFLESLGLTHGHAPGQLRQVRNGIGSVGVGTAVFTLYLLRDGFTWWSVILVSICVSSAVYYWNPDLIDPNE